MHVQADQRITAVFMDPWANHVLVVVTRGGGGGAGGGNGGGGSGAAGAGGGGGGAVDVYYVHRRWSKARLVSELKGVALSAVGWNYKQVGLLHTARGTWHQAACGTQAAERTGCGGACSTQASPVPLSPYMGTLLAQQGHGFTLTR